MSELLNQSLFWLYLSYAVLVIAAMLHMLYQHRSPQNLVAWLLTLLLLPYIGILLYMLFGSRKFFRNRTKSAIDLQPEQPIQTDNPQISQTIQLLKANRLFGTSEDNQVEIIKNDTDAYSAFLDAIEHAQHSIYIETYIFELDQTGHAILDALTLKAQQGLDVRILLDGIGSFSLYFNQKRFKPFKKSGGKLAFFHPVSKGWLKGHINLRNHRKIYLFDQSTLLTGGMNLSNDYLGEGSKINSIQGSTPQLSRWKDLMLRISGPANRHYAKIFAEDWHYATQQSLPTPQQPIQHPKSSTHSQLVHVVPSGPDIDGEPYLEILLHTLYSAKQQIQIVTPYFIPDSTVMKALLIALKRGVSVQLFTPNSSDILLFDLGRSSYMSELAEAGAEIFYYTDTILHAKLLLIDQDVILSGSANLDYRSLYINYEVVNVFYDPELIEKAQNWINQLKPTCISYTPSQNRVRRLLENLTRIIAPIL